ncbi:MAG: TolC family protein [Gemmatimonadaceae bacterium]
MIFPAPRTLATAALALAGVLALDRPALAQVATGASPVTAAARDLSLDDALRIAESQSADVAVARAGVQRANGLQTQARSALMPQVYGSANYTRTLKSQYSGLGSSAPDTTPAKPANCGSFVAHPELPLATRLDSIDHQLLCSGGGSIGSLFSNLPFGRLNNYQLGLSATQTVFDARVFDVLRAANSQKRTAEVALTSAHAQLLVDVASAYFDAALSDRLVVIAEANYQQADTTLAQTRLARQVGNSAEFDLLRAQVTRDNARPVVIQRRADRDVAYMRLKQLLNLPLDDAVRLTSSLGDSAAAPASQRLASITAARPDTSTDVRAPVRQAVEGVTTQRAQLGAARAQRLPAITLNSQYGRVAYPSGGLPAWSDFLSNWTVGIGLQVPIFVGFRIRGDEQVAEANLAEARARLQQTRELAALDTRNSLSRMNAAQAQFEATAGTVDQANRAYSIATVRYREGISTQTELTDSRILLQQAEANRAQAARDLQIARLRVALIRDLPLSTLGGSTQQGAPGQQSGAQTNPSAQQQFQLQQRQSQPAAATTTSSTGTNP